MFKLLLVILSLSLLLLNAASQPTGAFDRLRQFIDPPGAKQLTGKEEPAYSLQIARQKHAQRQNFIAKQALLAKEDCRTTLRYELRPIPVASPLGKPTDGADPEAKMTEYILYTEHGLLDAGSSSNQVFIKSPFTNSSNKCTVQMHLVRAFMAYGGGKAKPEVKRESLRGPTLPGRPGESNGNGPSLHIEGASMYKFAADVLDLLPETWTVEGFARPDLLMPGDEWLELKMTLTLKIDDHIPTDQQLPETSSVEDKAPSKLRQAYQKANQKLKKWVQELSLEDISPEEARWQRKAAAAAEAEREAKFEADTMRAIEISRATSDKGHLLRSG